MLSPGERREPIVTIDGPAGVGKSSAAKRLAGRLGFRYIETGAMYRAMAVKVSLAGLPPEPSPELERLARSTEIEIDRAGAVRLDGQDVTEAVRSPRVGQLASRLSALKVVREVLTSAQRKAALEGAVILEGRDTGSVVAPEAEVKFYLDASLAERARRRAGELAGRGERSDLDEVKREMNERDLADSSRALAPLVRPDDALYVDSSALSLEEVVELMLKEVERVRCSMRS
jgi:cytidylate kinase